MKSQLLNNLTQKYNLSLIKSHQNVHRGYLSQNTILHTDDASYFLKQYRFDRPDRVENAHSAKFLFAGHGLPIILPLKDETGATYIQQDDRFYSLFPFVQGHHSKRGELTNCALESMAIHLAKLHLISKDDVPSFRQNSYGWDRDAFISRGEELLQIIDTKPTHDTFDTLAHRILVLRLSLAAENKRTYGEFGLQNDHLLHGDYHEANLFFDVHDHVSHIFDLEKAGLGPRVFEVIRCLDFTCFSDGTQGGRSFAEKNFAAAITFLRAYQTLYPMSSQMFFNGYWAYYLDKIHSTWVESEHYIYNNNRVDGFLPGMLEFLLYFSKNMESFLARFEGSVF